MKKYSVSSAICDIVDFTISKVDCVWHLWQDTPERSELGNNNCLDEDKMLE